MLVYGKPELKTLLLILTSIEKASKTNLHAVLVRTYVCWLHKDLLLAAAAEAQVDKLACMHA